MNQSEGAPTELGHLREVEQFWDPPEPEHATRQTAQQATEQFALTWTAPSSEPRPQRPVTPEDIRIWRRTLLAVLHAEYREDRCNMLKHALKRRALAE